MNTFLHKQIVLHLIMKLLNFPSETKSQRVNQTNCTDLPLSVSTQLELVLRPDRSQRIGNRIHHNKTLASSTRMYIYYVQIEVL